MAKVYGIGETVLDILFRNNKPEMATPGGSVLNALVSLGRLGVEANFISEYGEDNAGKYIDNYLKENLVNTNLVHRTGHYKTSIALAFLDEKNDASYSFYKDIPEKRLSNVEIDFDEDDIFLFGSFFSISDNVREPLIRLLSDANTARSIIIYDPNFRRPHLDELEHVKPFILENIGFADIVRGSDEDFDLIFGASSAEAAWHYVSEAGCSNLIYTSNKNQVAILSPGISLYLDVPPILTVSTVGAGDNFNAGIIWSLIREEITKRDLEHLPEKIWRLIAGRGIDFSAEVCKRNENYISVEFAAEMLKH